MAAPSTGRGLVRRVASASAAGTMAGIRDKKRGILSRSAPLEGGNGALLFQRFHRGKQRLESLLFASCGRAEAAGPGQARIALSRSRLAGIEADHRGQQQRIGQAMGR